MNRNEIAEIVKTIELYYPSPQDYTEERFPSNKSLTALTSTCQDALVRENEWEQLLRELQSLFQDSQILDSTLLQASEPGLLWSIYFEKKRVMYRVVISILDNYYTLVHLSKLRDVKVETILKRFVTSRFPSHCYLSHEECLEPVPSVRVPNIVGSYLPDWPSPTIADCLFGPRSMGGYFEDSFWD